MSIARVCATGVVDVWNVRAAAEKTEKYRSVREYTELKIQWRSQVHLHDVYFDPARAVQCAVGRTVRSRSIRHSQQVHGRSIYSVREPYAAQLARKQYSGYVLLIDSRRAAAATTKICRVDGPDTPAARGATNVRPGWTKLDSNVYTWWYLLRA
jgi:hypothetical protein